MAICQLCSINYKKKGNLIQKQPSCKKVCGPQEGHCGKDVKSKVVAKNGCDGRLVAKILIMTI